MPDQPNNDLGRSEEAITTDAIKLLTRYVNAEVTIPDCPLKKQRAIWKRARILKMVARKLNPNDGAGMEIKVTVDAQ